jgi:hypothetical protein
MQTAEQRKGKQMTRREIIPPPDVRISRGDVVFDRKAVTDEATGRVTGTVEGYRVCTRLERMWKRGPNQGGITEGEYKAGCQFAEDWDKAEASTRSCMNHDTGGDPVSAIVRNGSRMNRADRRLQSASAALGWFLVSVVRWVAVEGRPVQEWGRLHLTDARAGIKVLRKALQVLAEHYGKTAQERA